MSALRTEIRAFLRLAWPMVLSAVGFQAMVTTDVLMIGRLGPEALAANGLAGHLYGTILLFGIGVASAVGGLLAQAYGARDPERLRSTTAQAFWVVLAIALPIIALLWNAEPVLIALGQDPATAALGQTYLWGVAPAALFGLWNNVLRGLFATAGRATFTMVVTWAGVGLNALLDYLLIYGTWGFPRLELLGSGLATSLVTIGMFAVLVVTTLTGEGLRELGIFRRIHVLEIRRVAEILRVGMPSGVMLMLEAGAFSGAGIMMGWIGTDELAAYSVVMPVFSLIFMVPMGLSAAATVRVGNAHGAGHTGGVRRAGAVAFGLVLLFMSVMSLLLWTFPGAIARLYLGDDPASATVLALAASLLSVAAIFQIVDGVQVVGASVLRGISDTKVPMWLSVAGYWVLGMPAGYVLGFLLGFGAVGIVYGLTLALAFMALVLTLRFILLTRAAAPVTSPAAAE